MQTIYRKLGDFKPLIFKVDLSDYNKTSEDILDIFCSIKTDLNSLDDALFLKQYTLGQITFSGKKSMFINVEWPYNEYNNLPIGEYKLGLFIKFIGDNVADENVSQTFNISIVQDFLKQN